MKSDPIGCPVVFFLQSGGLGGKDWLYAHLGVKHRPPIGNKGQCSVACRCTYLCTL